MQTTRILIVDDNAIFRGYIKEDLASEPDIEVIGEASNTQEAMRQVREFKPDVVLMDVKMPGTNGIDATRQLKEELPNLKVIVLTIFDIEEYREAAMANGASGYVIKKDLVEELLPAIRGTFSDG